MARPRKSRIFGSLLFISVILLSFSAEASTASGAGYANPTPPGVIVPAPTSFHTYDSLMSEIMQLSAAYPDLVTNVTIGTTWENRSIVALRMTMPGNSSAKENVLFMGLHHADEWMSTEVVMYLVHYFLANAKTTPEIRAILDKANVWFIPMVNPDGYEYSRLHDSLWRKNRRNNGDGTFGVDLNRNYGYEWNTGGFAADGSLIVTGSIEYPGPSSFSEPETQAIRDFALVHPLVFSISYHTAGEWILFPWSYTRAPTTADGVFRAYSQEMASTNGYRLLQEGHSSHNKPGNSDDWLYHALGTLAFTFEVGPGYSSQDEQQIAGVTLANVMSAVHGAELSLGLIQLSCTPQLLLCVPELSVASLAVPGLFGAVFFGLRMRRRRENRLNRLGPGASGYSDEIVEHSRTVGRGST